MAAKITISRDPSAVVVNAFVAEEDDDNRRFLADVEKWLGVPITVLRDEKYGASAYEVFRRVRITKTREGAPCTGRLKRQLLAAWSLPGDVAVIGYTLEEQDRAAKFLTHGDGEFPLIDAGLTKADCLAMVERAGIELPRMYRLGYANANCIGCVKGGMGYWNKIRRDFPAVFEEMATIEEEIGDGAFLFRDRKKNIRISLRQLDPNAGRHDEPEAECGFSCLMMETELEQLECIPSPVTK